MSRKTKPDFWWRDGCFHVELPNCIVNMRPGLSDLEGRPVDSVEIIPNSYAGEEVQVIPDVRNVRVVKVK